MTKQQLLIGTFILLISTPFIFITNFYPLMRFGMYAEPVNLETEIEYFEVYSNGTVLDFNGDNSPLPPSYINYLARKFHYENRHQEFLHTIAKLFPTLHQFDLVQKKYNSKALLTDSITVAHYQK